MLQSPCEVSGTLSSLQVFRKKFNAFLSRSVYLITLVISLSVVEHGTCRVILCSFLLLLCFFLVRNIFSARCCHTVSQYFNIHRGSLNAVDAGGTRFYWRVCCFLAWHQDFHDTPLYLHANVWVVLWKKVLTSRCQLADPTDFCFSCPFILSFPVHSTSAVEAISLNNVRPGHGNHNHDSYEKGKIYCKNVWVYMGVKLGLSPEVKEADWERFQTGCHGKYVGRGSVKWRRNPLNGEIYN
jgi:hypothetical protein